MRWIEHQTPFFICTCIIASLLVFSAGCLAIPEKNVTSEKTVTPAITMMRNSNDFPIWVQINGSPHQYSYSDLPQHNYSIIPILYRQEPGAPLRSGVYFDDGETICWDEDIPKTMNSFLGEPAIGQRLYNGSIILGLDYRPRYHCGYHSCPRCYGFGPVLRILTNNATEEYMLWNATSGAPWISGP